MESVYIVLLLLLLHTHDHCLGAKIYDHPSPISPSRPLTQQPRSLPSPSNAAFAANMPGMARLESLDVKCGRTALNVELKFTASFPGVVYSKGHFSDPACMYVRETDPASDVFRFTIPLDGCGTQAEEDSGTSGQERTVGNTLILQTDPLIQEVWDEARHITCTWSHSMTKSVAFLPIKVYEPETIGVQLDARSVNTLMEIQRGTREVGGPLHSPPTGYVHVGDDISVVMYVKGPEMDANVVSCNATTTGRSTSVALVDSQGCLLRPDLLTPFAKTHTTNGVDADLMLYSYMKAFNIAESPEFVINCELELCENSCPDMCVGGAHSRRKKRSQEEEKKEEEEEEEVMSSSSSSSYSRKVRLEKAVVVLSREDQSRCLLQSVEALMSLALLMTLAASLSIFSAVLGYKLWSLKAEMRRKGVYNVNERN